MQKKMFQMVVGRLRNELKLMLIMQRVLFYVNRTSVKVIKGFLEESAICRELFIYFQMIQLHAIWKHRSIFDQEPAEPALYVSLRSDLESLSNKTYCIHVQEARSIQILFERIILQYRLTAPWMNSDI
jgi:hypothetical protein